jgi:hypothetical protein
MAVFPPAPLATVILSAPILYYFCSHHTLSGVILYVHSVCVTIWLTSIPEIRLLLQTFLGFPSSKPISHSRNEMYGLQNTLYNIDISPKGLWFNMGFWDGQNLQFSEACRALVHKVIDGLGGQENVHNARALGQLLLAEQP